MLIETACGGHVPISRIIREEDMTVYFRDEHDQIRKAHITDRAYDLICVSSRKFIDCYDGNENWTLLAMDTIATVKSLRIPEGDVVELTSLSGERFYTTKDVMHTLVNITLEGCQACIVPPKQSALL